MNTAKKITCLSKDKTDNPKLFARKMANGNLSLYLEFYLGYGVRKNPKTGKETICPQRRQTPLHLFLYANPRTIEERQHNKETEEMAKKLRFDKGQEMLQAETGYKVVKRKDADFLQYYREYISNYTKTDIGNLKMAYKRFVEYLCKIPKYRAFANGLKPALMDKDMIAGYAEYLQGIYHGEGAHTIYARFKKVVKHAVEHDFMMKNPCNGISVKIDTDSITKEVLSIDEIKALLNASYTGNPNIKRAFLFCCYTGLRWCDVSELTFANVDYSNGLLKFTQKKTEGHSAHSSVTIPLNETLLSLIGEKGERNDKIFILPTHNAALKELRIWTKRAGIDKHITWHCARHSFAVNVLSNGANIKTVSSLMGHSTIAMTEKYLHVIDNQKRAAIDSLPSFTI